VNEALVIPNARMHADHPTGCEETKWCFDDLENPRMRWTRAEQVQRPSDWWNWTITNTCTGFGPMA